MWKIHFYLTMRQWFFVYGLFWQDIVIWDRQKNGNYGSFHTILGHFRYFEQAIKATGCESFSLQLISSFLKNNLVPNFQFFLNFQPIFGNFDKFYDVFFAFCLWPLTSLKLLCCLKMSKFEILAKSLWSAHNFHIWQVLDTL